MNLGKLKLTELREIGRTLKFKDVHDRSGVSLRQELQHLAKTFIAGQVDIITFVVILTNHSLLLCTNHEGYLPPSLSNNPPFHEAIQQGYLPTMVDSPLAWCIILDKIINRVNVISTPVCAAEQRDGLMCTVIIFSRSAPRCIQFKKVLATSVTFFTVCLNTLYVM